MQPRLMIRTHYQAAEPRLLIAAVTECTSPTRRRDEETTARALVVWARSVGQVLSLPGAIYALGNCRTLGFLNRTHLWTSTGLAFGYGVAGSGDGSRSWRPELGAAEQYVFLRNYLVGAGAILIKFGSWLLKESRTTHDEMRRDAVLEELVVEALNDYLKIASHAGDRAAIRQRRDRLSRTRYSSVTKRHKRYPLLTTMRRLNLLEECQGALTPDKEGRLARVVEAIPDVAALELGVADDRLRTVVLRALVGTPVKENRAEIDRVLAAAYRYALRVGLQLCPLGFLDDAVCGTSAARSVAPVNLTAEGCLERWRQRDPSGVRFHVDRRGRRAFVRIASTVLERMGT